MKTQKKFDFLVFSGHVKWQHRPEILPEDLAASGTKYSRMDQVKFSQMPQISLGLFLNSLSHL